MSGRFSLFRWPQEWRELPGFAEPPQRWNIAPRQQVLLLHDRDGQRQVTPALWGFTPGWSQDLQHVASHARSETAGEQAFFSDALARRRGVLPANGFFEWRGPQNTQKQAYWLSRPDEMLYMAALWEPYRVAGQEYCSVAMLTRQAAYLRRPVLIAESDLNEWLDPQTTAERIQQLLQAQPLALQERRVGRQVNDPQHEGPDCIRPL